MTHTPQPGDLYRVRRSGNRLILNVQPDPNPTITWTDNNGHTNTCRTTTRTPKEDQ